LALAWEALRRPVGLRAYQWDTGRVRPENAPVRRVVALAHLALRWPAGGLLPVVKQVLRSAAPAANRGRAIARSRGIEPGPPRAADPGAANRRLAALIAVPCPEGYWAEHWDFGVPARSPSGGSGETAALVGPSRAADVVVNVLLPLAAAVGALEGDQPLLDRAWAAYRAHAPLAENWITRLVRQRAHLTGDRHATVGSAQLQQGLIQLYVGPCHALRCAACPLGGAPTPSRSAPPSDYPPPT
jgi:hypothetical protein